MAGEDVRAVVFDLGGVLIDWDPGYVFRPYFRGLHETEEASDAQFEAFLRDAFREAHLACHDSPAPFAETLAPFQARHPAYAEALGMMATHWNGFLGGPMGETVALLDALHGKGVLLYALSNWPAQTWPPAEREAGEYGFLDRFGGIVVSGQVGMRKPQREIYAHTLETFGLAGPDCLFIDDLAENITAARAAGMKAERFEDAEKLARDLAAYGLL